MPRIPTSMTTIMSGVRYMPASFVVLARADTTVMSMTTSSVVDTTTSTSSR